ncbi:MAG TPA: heme-binding protein [Candidatus Acidoferrum sp.]|nr:heme-binding protein [Candidatus Acidoferrum sp.]
MKARILSLVVGTLLVFTAASVSAQGPPPYGAPISLEQAKKAMAGAEAEAKKNNWPVVIVILDSGGQLVMLQRLDNAQWGSVEIAKEKARSAVALRRPTKALQDLIAQGGANLRLLNIGFSVLEGGIPIVVDGKIIGGIGVSGVTSQQDAQTAQAGIDAMK